MSSGNITNGVRIQNTLKPPFRNKTQQFQQKCGECLLALQQYKMKTNFAGCNMNKQDFKKYYAYYQSKPRKRLEIAKNKIQSFIRAWQKNVTHLQALELKVVNNMMKNYRKRMNLQTNQPTNFSYTRFEKQQTQLLQSVMLNDHKKIQDIDKLLNKIKQADENAMQTLQQKLQTNSQNKKPNFAKVFKTINKAQVRYYRYYQTFERSIANSINQLHSHIEKLNQFYTVWENLGSSLIYQMKSDKEVLIDKTIEEKKNKNYITYQQNQDDIQQVIEVMPINSKTRQIYLQKLENLKYKGHRPTEAMYNNNLQQAKLKNNKNILKLNFQSINKVSWYENEAQDRKQYSTHINFNDQMILREKQDGYFKYTYEQLHKQTLQYMEEFKNKHIYNDFNSVGGEQLYYDRFYVFCEKKNKYRNEKYHSQKLQKYNVPPQMKFNCWYDRLGSRGLFNVNDFPMNLVQRRIQYEFDRQNQLDILDEKRRTEYNNKENKIDFIEDQGGFNIGFKYLDSFKELQSLKNQLSFYYDPQYLPKPKDINEINEQKKLKAQKEKQQTVNDFSDTDSQKQEYNKLPKYKQSQMSEMNNETSQKIKVNDKVQQIMYQINQTFNKSYNSISQKNKSQKNKQTKISQISFQKSTKQLKKQYPWLQMKEKKVQMFKLFIQNYMPELQKITITKHKKQIYILGFTQQEIERAQFKYLYNHQKQLIKQCFQQLNFKNFDLDSTAKQSNQNLSKIYLVNKLYYVKVQPLFFHSERKLIKIIIFLTTQISFFQQLKKNLQQILSYFGKCAFKVNLDFCQKNMTNQQRTFAVIGNIIDDIKQDLNMKNMLQNQNVTISAEQRSNIIKKGQKVYESYQKYYTSMKQVQKQ